ncbi:hypothetical protein PT286_04375 [Neisseriaceae bacterium ESL0693]|nr:hypothetical protein [Neisseriaceae bacterium ESL0693]
MDDIQRYRQIFDNLPTFFIENQRLRFEAVFFQDKDGLAKRDGQTYLCAFSGWLASVRHEADEQAARRKEVVKLRQQVRNLLQRIEGTQAKSTDKDIDAIRNNIMNMITRISC